MYNNVFYFYYINSIGGVESYFYYLAKKYQDLDITVFYSVGDENQIRRLRKFIRIKQYNGEQIKCKRFFINYRADTILKNVEAEECIFVIHADYKNQTNIVFKPHDKINRYIAVSEYAAKSFEEVTGIKPEVSYNPICLEKPKRVLNLISATRLSIEKRKR